jgi:hypothetical protein
MKKIILKYCFFGFFLALLFSFSIHAYSGSADIALHQIQGFPQANIIQLEDGSEWSIPLEELHRMHFWAVGDWISLYPNKGFFCRSSYFFYHERLGESLSISPFSGPLINGFYTQQVIGMDWETGSVYLMNGQGMRTVWIIDPSDYALFQEWEINDAVVLGRNYSWLPCLNSYENILINVPSNHYVKARLY